MKSIPVFQYLKDKLGVGLPALARRYGVSHSTMVRYRQQSRPMPAWLAADLYLLVVVGTQNKRRPMFEEMFWTVVPPGPVAPQLEWLKQNRKQKE